MSDEDKPYKVGYKNPPKEKQFKKGKSGNPKGRPPDHLRQIIWPSEFRYHFMRALNRFVTVREGGTTRKAIKLDVIMDRMIEKAMKGDMAIAKFLMKESERIFVEFEDGKVKMQMLAHDLEDENDERSYQAFLKSSGKTEQEFPRLPRHRIRLPVMNEDKEED